VPTDITQSNMVESPYQRLLNHALLNTLAQQTRVSFKLHPIDDSLPAEMTKVLLDLKAGSSHLIRVRPADMPIFARAQGGYRQA